MGASESRSSRRFLSAGHGLWITAGTRGSYVAAGNRGTRDTLQRAARALARCEWARWWGQVCRSVLPGAVRLVSRVQGHAPGTRLLRAGDESV